MTLVRTHRVTVALLLALPACSGPGSRAGDDRRVDAARKLEILVEDYFEETLRLSPLFATSIGDLRYNDQFANSIGEEHLRAVEALDRRCLERLRGIDRDLLYGQSRLTYDIFKRDRELALEGRRFPFELLSIDQFTSVPSFFAVLGSGASLHPFKTVQHYDDFLSRIDGFVTWCDQAVENMTRGMSSGVVMPRQLMEKTLPQLAAHVVESPQESVFYMPIRKFPESFSAADRARLEAAYRQAIVARIVPTYERLHAFIRDRYLPRTRESVAHTALPDGEAWYAYLIKTSTTTEMGPDEIHAIGLAEVARIRREMEGIMRRVGFEGDLAEFFEHLKSDDRFYFDEAEALLQGYRELQQRVNAVLPRLFDLFPKADYEVREVEAFRAASAAGASYVPASPDGSRPGVFYVNTHDLRAQPKYGMVTLSLHEASPGHHFQIAIQQEIEELPRFRRFEGYSAFFEGWALYSESLGKELGLFEDPYDYYGRLSDEMLRAMRLVVDTGLHARGWTRERSIRYMLENSSMTEPDVVAEVERYIAVPAQALGYKLGQITISRLRAEAEEALGDGFDLKAFHRELLIDGAVPLGVLETKLREWIARRLAAGEGAR